MSVAARNWEHAIPARYSTAEVRPGFRKIQYFANSVNGLCVRDASSANPKRGEVRVLQAAAVERPDDLEPTRLGRGKQSQSATVGFAARSGSLEADVVRLQALLLRPRVFLDT